MRPSIEVRPRGEAERPGAPTRTDGEEASSTKTFRSSHRLHRAVHDALRRIAFMEGRTISDLINEGLDLMLAARDCPSMADIRAGKPETAAAAAGERADSGGVERQQLGARITKATHRQLKAQAALRGVKVQHLVEQAITEFLAKSR